MGRHIEFFSPTFKDGFVKGVVQAFDLFGALDSPGEPASARYRRRREASRIRLARIGRSNWEALSREFARPPGASPR